MKSIEQKVPLKFKSISLLFRIIDYQKKYGKDDSTINKAKGEIEKINILKNRFDQKIGDIYLRLMWDEKNVEYSTAWVYLGINYYKQISRTLSRNC
jgi:hypothetical protein